MFLTTALCQMLKSIGIDLEIPDSVAFKDPITGTRFRRLYG